ncbi:MAG: tetratricopeptide repeat protein [Gammaproteobacteria bacterium]|nr:tetratricopeptide repeat protein [Gammaproteobacteria bacterium]MDX2488753.1 tetratricopeptide repeat protein [Gammaproteobacteria bacterium]
MSLDVENILKNARSLAEQGKKEEAQMCLLAVLKEEPDNISALLILGGAYFVDNNFKEARIVFERLVSIEPGTGQYSIALFNALWRLQQTEEALEEIRRFVAVADKVTEKDTLEQYVSILKAIETESTA